MQMKKKIQLISKKSKFCSKEPIYKKKKNQLPRHLFTRLNTFSKNVIRKNWSTSRNLRLRRRHNFDFSHSMLSYVFWRCALQATGSVCRSQICYLLVSCSTDNREAVGGCCVHLLEL